MNSTSTNVQLLRVFEHQTLRVGQEVNGCMFTQKHFHALVRFSGKNSSKYFSLLHQGVKFSHYVGVIQIGQLTIEILPKADKKENADTHQWHHILMDMLKVCRLLKVETLASARLQLRSHSILELYFEIFIKEVEKLLRKGLFRSYRKVEKNARFLKGKLIFHKNVQKNFAHQERFFSEFQQYDYKHPLNLILRRALDVLETLVFSPTLLTRVRELQSHFPSSSQVVFTERHFLQFMHNRKAKPYHAALEIARLLVLNYSPDLRGGKHHLLAILFDMNVLFEEFVFRELKRLENENLQVQRQQRKPFFQRRKIQPDIVVTSFGKKYILDTKWKVLRTAQPSMSDLKQMYIYNQYFGAERSLLLYPKVYDTADLPPTPYQPHEDISANKRDDNKIMYCEVCFLIVNISGSLSRNVGQYILAKIS